MKDSNETSVSLIDLLLLVRHSVFVKLKDKVIGGCKYNNADDLCPTGMLQYLYTAISLFPGDHGPLSFQDMDRHYSTFTSPLQDHTRPQTF